MGGCKGGRRGGSESVFVWRMQDGRAKRAEKARELERRGRSSLVWAERGVDGRLRMGAREKEEGRRADVE